MPLRSILVDRDDDKTRVPRELRALAREARDPRELRALAREARDPRETASQPYVTAV